MSGLHRIKTLGSLVPWIPSVVQGQYKLYTDRRGVLLVRLMGGLGNQMFQYATAANLARTTGRNIYVDISYLCDRNRDSTFIARDYQLDLFRHESPLVYVPKDKSIVVSDNQFSFADGVTINQIDIDSIVNQIKRCTSPVMLNGYWQSTQSVGERDQVVELFRFNPNLSTDAQNLLAKIQADESVMVNVRRTDFLTNNVNGIVGLDYYSKAFEHITYLYPSARFYIFSDDVDWCREQFCGQNEFVVGHEYSGDRFSTYLYLMKSCKHFVIPNSTFAWWAAYLGYSKESIVTRPKLFMPGIGHEHDELFDGLDWTIID